MRLNIIELPPVLLPLFLRKEHFYILLYYYVYLTYEKENPFLMNNVL